MIMMAGHRLKEKRNEIPRKRSQNGKEKIEYIYNLQFYNLKLRIKTLTLKTNSQLNYKQCLIYTPTRESLITSSLLRTIARNI